MKFNRVLAAVKQIHREFKVQVVPVVVQHHDKKVLCIHQCLERHVQLRDGGPQMRRVLQAMGQCQGGA